MVHRPVVIFMSCRVLLVSFPVSEFQIGLAVGDIDTIRKTAALERYTSQVSLSTESIYSLLVYIRFVSFNGDSIKCHKTSSSKVVLRNYLLLGRLLPSGYQNT